MAAIRRRHFRSNVSGRATSAVVAVIGFFVWFIGFSGSSPIPLNVSY